MMFLSCELEVSVLNEFFSILIRVHSNTKTNVKYWILSSMGVNERFYEWVSFISAKLERESISNTKINYRNLLPWIILCVFLRTSV